MSDCLFCKFVSKELPTREVYRDEEVLAFEDINPQASTHVLIIPAKHIASTNELTEADAPAIGKLYLAAKQIAAERGIAEDGYRLVMNCGPNAGQTVFHIHLHLLGGRALGWPPG